MKLFSAQLYIILIKLLREVKYFHLLGLDVPASAMEIYGRAETFRRNTGNLDLIVNMYNDNAKCVRYCENIVTLKTL